RRPQLGALARGGEWVRHARPLMTRRLGRRGRRRTDGSRPAPRGYRYVERVLRLEGHVAFPMPRPDVHPPPVDILRGGCEVCGSPRAPVVRTAELVAGARLLEIGSFVG